MFDTPAIRAILTEKADKLCEKLYDPNFAINKDVVDEVTLLYDAGYELVDSDVSCSVAELVDQFLLRALSVSRSLYDEVSKHFQPGWANYDNDCISYGGRDLNGYTWLIPKPSIRTENTDAHIL